LFDIKGLRPFSFRRILAWRFLDRFRLLERQRLARGVEAAEPILHLVDFVADPLEHGLEPQAVGREAVQMVEDAHEGMRRRRLAGVDLCADEIERPLEPRDLKEREVVCGIGVAPIKLLTDDLLDTTEAEVFQAAMARIDSPPMRRAKIRCARLCSSVKNWTGFASGAGMRLPFGETGSIA
jgi:hypothetical protein